MVYFLLQSLQSAIASAAALFADTTTTTTTSSSGSSSSSSSGTVTIDLLVARYADVFRVPAYLDHYKKDPEFLNNMKAQLREDINAENNAFSDASSTTVRLPKRHPFVENPVRCGPAGRLTGEIVDLLMRTNNSYCVSKSWIQNDRLGEFITDIHKNLLLTSCMSACHPDLTSDKPLLLQSFKTCIQSLADDMCSVSYGRALRVQWNEPASLRKVDKWGQSLHSAASFYAVAYHLAVFKQYIDLEAIQVATTAVDRALYKDTLISYNPLTHTHPQV